MRRWRMGSEIGLLGFHVWRRDTRSGRSARLTLRPIPALGGPCGFVDRSAERGRPYVYDLEALALDGSRMSVTPTGTVRRASR